MRSIKSSSDFDRLIKKGEAFVVYKHSPESDLSAKALDHVEQAIMMTINEGESVLYKIDVIEDRHSSQHVAEFANIKHESPQILLFEKNNNGQLVVTEHVSHGLISTSYVRGVINRAMGKKAFDYSTLRNIEKIKDEA